MVLLGAAAVVALLAVGLATLLPGQAPPASPIAAASPNPIPVTAVPIAVDPTVPPAPVSITATPVTAAACPGLRMFGFAHQGTSVSWSLDNGEPSAARLVGFNPEFPADNPLLEVWLGAAQLWQAPEEGPYPESGELPNDGRARLDSGAVASLRLDYAWSDQVPGNYALELIFDNGCSLKTTW